MPQHNRQFLESDVEENPKALSKRYLTLLMHIVEAPIAMDIIMTFISPKIWKKGTNAKKFCWGTIRQVSDADIQDIKPANRGTSLSPSTSVSMHVDDRVSKGRTTLF